MTTLSAMSNEPSIGATAAGVDMKFEVVVIPSRMSIGRRRFTQSLGGG
jgi:hypothetical protein